MSRNIEQIDERGNRRLSKSDWERFEKKIIENSKQHGNSRKLNLIDIGK